MRKQSLPEGISLIMCCYNSAKRLEKTIQHLASQKLHSGTLCEIIIVDNASTDDTGRIAAQMWQSHNRTDISFKVVVETQSGQSYARKRGIFEANYECVCFCDDDNWLTENYLKIGLDIFQNQKDVAIIGGYGHPVFEKEPPEWFQQYALCYAIGPHAEMSGDLTNTRGDVYGAGSFFRKSALMLLFDNGFESIISGRTKGNLSSGDDNELCIAVKLLGFRIWYSEDLKFFHFIPEARLKLQYLLKLQKGIAHSFCMLRPYYHITIPDLSLSNRSFIRNNWLWFALPRLFSFVFSKSILYAIYYRVTGTINAAIINAESQLEYLKTLMVQRDKFLLNYKKIKNASWYRNRTLLFREYNEGD